MNWLPFYVTSFFMDNKNITIKELFLTLLLSLLFHLHLSYFWLSYSIFTCNISLVCNQLNEDNAFSYTNAVWYNCFEKCATMEVEFLSGDKRYMLSILYQKFATIVLLMAAQPFILMICRKVFSHNVIPITSNLIKLLIKFHHFCIFI